MYIVETPMNCNDALESQIKPALAELAYTINKHHARLSAILKCNPAGWACPKDFLPNDILLCLGRYPALNKQIRLERLVEELAELHNNIYEGYSDI